STLRAPLSPAISRCHVASTPHPSGVTMPMPVTTTRLMDPPAWPANSSPAPSILRQCRRPTHLPGIRTKSNASIAGQRTTRNTYIPSRTQRLLPSGLATVDRYTRRSALGVLFEEFYRIANGQDGFGGVIGNLAAELLLKRHDQLDGVEAVGAEVVDETRAVRHLIRLHAKVFHDDLLYPLANVTHFPKPRAPLDWPGRSGDPAIVRRGIVVVDGSSEIPRFVSLSAPPHRPVVSGVTTLQLA